MQLLLSLVTALLWLASLSSAANANAVNAFERVKRLPSVLERHQPENGFSHPRLQKRAMSYLTNTTKKFVVNGSAIPDVPFDVGESYAGLLPISADLNETRELFFWFFPSSNPEANEEITIWFNGGPGCSSLSGLLTENGPFLWDAGTFAPTPNPYSWTNLTNMVWVEQPVGVGFTQGVPDIRNEVELGLEFIGFWKQFITTFGMEKYKVYITGESYGGYYVPYVANAFITAADTTYYNLAGVAINDPIIGDGSVQQEIAIVPFVEYWANLFYLNETFLTDIRARHEACGYADYLDKYLEFPPPTGSFPILNPTDERCDVFDAVYSAVLEVNPCFNVYHITDTCPHLWSVLGIVNAGDYEPPGASVYFNRTDVQKAINAPVGTNWLQCTNTNVFGAGNNSQYLSDQSLGPAQDDVLKSVIEYTNNTFIGVGNLDFLLSTNGTLLALQNVTWNGKQGFQEFPGTPFYVPYHPEYNGQALAGAGDLGVWGEERGLTFYQVQLSGHELPEYAPGAAYRVIETMLGRVENLSDTADFTTQMGNYTGTMPVKRFAQMGF